MAETSGEFVQTGQDQSPERPSSNPYFDTELRTAARSLLTWGDPSQRQKSEAYYFEKAAERGLSAEAAKALLPVLNSGRSPAEK